jgi:hypothetical protein
MDSKIKPRVSGSNKFD